MRTMNLTTSAQHAVRHMQHAVHFVRLLRVMITWTVA
jgi:hypothetical protein